VNLEPDNEEYLYGNAELAYIRGKDQQALDYLKRAVAQKTQRPEAYHLMGNVYLLQKNYTQALANMDRAIDLDKTQPIFYLGKALIYRQMKQPQRAITFANYALERNKAFLKAAALAADIHLNEVYDPKEARRYVYYILEADSLHPVGHYYMGYVLYRQAAETGDRSLYKPLMNKAIEEYSQAIKADPTYNDARYQRGYLYQQLDKLDKATADYKAVLERNPQDARAAFQLGSLYEYYKDYSRALKYYRQALQAKPDFAEARQAIQELERNLPDKK
jgi:tetratricopeptide (TPR) repeat protein